MPESTLAAFSPASTIASAAPGRIMSVASTKSECSTRGSGGTPSFFGPSASLTMYLAGPLSFPTAGMGDAYAELRARGERGEALEPAHAQDLVRDQHVRDAALHERLGLRHLLAEHPDRASRDLAFRDRRAVVRLVVRAHAHAPRD